MKQIEAEIWRTHIPELDQMLGVKRAPWERHNAGFSTLSASDLVDPLSLAEKLNQSSNALTAYLKTYLSEATLKLLSVYKDKTPDPLLLQTALVQDLNKIIKSQPIHRLERFASVRLRERTSKLLAQNPQGESLQRLNRLLLEDAFDKEISRNHFGGAAHPVILLRGAPGSGKTTLGLQILAKQLKYQDEHKKADEKKLAACRTLDGVFFEKN
jgi:hypothetical protein